jgi:hypothetical protein
MANPDDITQAESSGNSTKPNPHSSALGIGQFVNRTWLDMIKRYRPELAQGKSDAEILELRKNPIHSREMTQRYAEENEAKLRQAGLPVTPGSTYLMHFAGPTGAVKLMQADPDTPVESILSADAIKANPHLQGKTAGWVIEWANKKMEDAAAAKPKTAAKQKTWDPQPPIPDLAQTQAIDPAFSATQWLQRPTSPNVLQPDAASPFAPSAGAQEYAATPYLEETKRAQKMLDNLPHAPSASPRPAASIFPLQSGGPKPPPQPRPTMSPAQSPQLQPSRPGIGPPLDITPQTPELSPGMPIPGATGPTVIGGPGPLRPLVPPATSRPPASTSPTAPAADPLSPLHFAPQTPQNFGPFEVPGMFRSDVFGGSRVAPGADGAGTNTPTLPTPAFGASGAFTPYGSPVLSGIPGLLPAGNPVADWWNNLVTDVDAISRRNGFGGLNLPMPGPTPPTQTVFDSGLPGMLQRAGAFDPPAGGLLGMLQELERNHPDDEASA